VGENEGINLSNHIMPQKGVPLIFETFLPWSNENPAKISIEWTKSMYSTLPGPMDHFSTVFQSSNTSGGRESYYGNQPSYGGQFGPIPAHRFNSYSPEARSNSIPTKGELTHGIIYIGISGFFE